MNWNYYSWIFISFFVAHQIVEISLEILQNNYLKNRKDQVPKHLKGKVDIETIRKSVLYNRDKLTFGLFVRFYDAIPLWAFVLFGFSAIDTFCISFGFGPLVTGLMFFAIASGIGTVLSLPTQLYFTFSIEQRHGFNRQTVKDLFLDKLKEILIGTVLGGILASIVLLIMQHTGQYWWIFAFAGVTIIQLLIMWIYPVLIMPIFNKFKPVDEELANDISGLAKKVGFPLKGVVQMDGSKRSGHSNAFIIGFKGARRIVLYDTLISKLTRPQLLAVLAHELGHFKLGHITRKLTITLVFMFGVFALLGFMVNQKDMYQGLGFANQSAYAALVVFGLLIPEVTFPFGLISRVFSRFDEFAADNFAIKAINNGYDLGDALVGLTKQNLSSPGSHKLYRAYYNSHPTLKQRLSAQKQCAKKNNLPLKRK